MENIDEAAAEAGRLISNSNSQETGYDSINNSIPFDGTCPPQRLPQYVAAFSATLTALAAGVILGWTSPIAVDIENGRYNNISVNSTEMGWIGSFSTIGALIACIPTGYLCDLMGRRTTLLLLIVPSVVGWSLLIWAKNLAMLYFGRFINGMVVGCCCIAAPLYTSEIAQKEIRGTLGSFFQLMITFGIFYAYVIGKFFSPIHYTVICSIVPVIACITLVFQPETPLFYIKAGNEEKARLALQRLRGPAYDVEIELNSIEGGVNNQANWYASLINSLRQRAMIRAIIISFGTMFFQQFCGINAVIFYTSSIFQSSGIKFDPKSATILVGAFTVSGTLISCMIVDKLGRRKLLLFSGFVMSITSFLLGLFDTLKAREIINPDNIGSYGVLPVTSLCVFVVAFSIGYGPIPWTISSEIFTPEWKSTACSVAGGFNWFLAFIITKFYLNVADSIGEDNTFYAFSIFSMLGVVFVYFIVIETKGKSIGQIQTELAG